MNNNRNDLTGTVLAYEAIHGAGAAVVVVILNQMEQEIKNMTKTMLISMRIEMF